MTCLALITSTSGLLPRQPIGRPDIDQAREIEALNAAWTDRRDTQRMCYSMCTPPHPLTLS